jgi:hypothetical protein
MFNIKNKKMNGKKKINKWKWLIYVEVMHFLWVITGKRGIFIEGCLFYRFDFNNKSISRYFWLHRYIMKYRFDDNDIHYYMQNNIDL